MSQANGNISQITMGAARKIADTVHAVAAIPRGEAARPNPSNTVSGVLWGTLTALWTPGSNTVTLQPCNSGVDGTSTGADTVTLFVSIPLPRNAQCLGAAAGDILAYVPLGFLPGTDYPDIDPYVLWQPPLIPWFGGGASTQYQIISNASPSADAPNLVNNWLQAADIPSD